MSTLTIPHTVKSIPRRQRPTVVVDNPDVSLMLRVREDDEAAFGELLRRHRPAVFGHFQRQLGNCQDAEDLTQEVFLRLFRSRKRYQPRAQFTTWLYHITQNVFRNALRSRRRKHCVNLDSPATWSEGSVTESQLLAGGTEPSDPAERAELAARVRAAVSTLPGRQRSAVVLHQLQEKSYKEVAARLSITPEAAKSLLYRARHQLRETLAGFMQTLR